MKNKEIEEDISSKYKENENSCNNLNVRLPRIRSKGH